MASSAQQRLESKTSKIRLRQLKRCHFGHIIPGNTSRSSQAKISFCPVIEHKYKGPTYTAHNIRQKTFVHALFCGDFLEAIHRTLVDVLFNGFFGLHLKPATHSVKRICSPCPNGNGSLGCSERAYGTHDTLV